MARTQDSQDAADLGAAAAETQEEPGFELQQEEVGADGKIEDLTPTVSFLGASTKTTRELRIGDHVTVVVTGRVTEAGQTQTARGGVREFRKITVEDVKFEG